MNPEMRNRFPGLEPFSTEQRDLFFGRETDLARLHEQVMMHQQVLLYAKSGLGKSSLINAGLIPQLASLPGARVLPIRIGTYVNLQSFSPLEMVQQALGKATDPYLDKVIANEDSLWYHFKAAQAAALADPEQPAPIFFLLFDQFEEIFSHAEETIFHFKKQMADLLYRAVPQHFRAVLEIKQRDNAELLTAAEQRLFYQPLQIKVLYAIREDRYYELNRLADYLPDLMQHRFLLGALDRAAAQASIVEPAAMLGANFATPPFTYTPAALQKILDFLTTGEQKTVETTQLQVLCSHIERLGKQVVEADDIPEFNNIFLQFYLDSIAALEPEDRERTRLFIEDYMIIERQRIAYHRLACLEYIPERALDLLLRERHLLRTERSSTGGISYELSHDTLVGPILIAKGQREAEELLREEQEAKRQAELRRAEEEAKRIVEEKRLREELEKEQAARKHELQLLAREQAAREEQQRALENEKAARAAQLRSLRRARIFLACAVVMALGAIIAYQYARQQAQIAEDQRHDALAQKKIADDQRATAEFQRKSAEMAYKRLSDSQIELLGDKYKIVEKLDANAARYLVDSMWKIDPKHPLSDSLHHKYYGP